MSFEVISLGGAVVDVFLETNVSDKGGKLCFDSGDKVLVEGLNFTTGGGGTNTAAAFAKAGLKTGFVGKIGNGANAEIILKDLHERKIKFLGVQCNKETGYSVVLGSKEKNRTILTFKGANNDLKFDDLNLKKLKTKWFYFSSAVGETLKTQIRLAKWAKRNGIKIAYNPSSYLTDKGTIKVKDLLKNVDVLILNEDEARGIGKDKYFEKLHSFGVEIVCVTRGKKGNEVSVRGKRHISLPRKIKVVERTGAGDAFASGFVASLIKTGDVVNAMKAGSLNAESVIQKNGAKNGLLDWKKIERNLNKIKVKQKI